MGSQRVGYTVKALASITVSICHFLKLSTQSTIIICIIHLYNSYIIICINNITQDRIYIYILSPKTKVYTLFNTLLIFHFIYFRTLSILIHKKVAQFVCFFKWKCQLLSHIWLFATPQVVPHEWQPTRLLCPWNSPGKNIAVGNHSSPGDLSNPGFEPRSPVLQDSEPTSLHIIPRHRYTMINLTSPLLVNILIESVFCYKKQCCRT